MLMAGLSKSYSQVETRYFSKGEASKFIDKPIRSTSDIKVMPSFDLAKLKKEDAKRDSTGGMLRFGKPFDVSYTLADGQWEDVDGGRMWSITFKSEGALSLNFIFDDFHLPEGAELYVINKEESVLFGPVTKESTTENGYFLTDIIEGDQASIYLFEPTNCEGLSSLTIKRVIHGYRHFESARELNRNYVYTQDVACYPNYGIVSDAVAMVLHGSGYFVGSGFLIMSADYSFKPYFITSYYVVSTDNNSTFSENEIYYAENSLFKFRYRKASCEGSNYVENCTYNQAKIRASWTGTEFVLLELKSNLKANPTLSWVGWTRTGCSGSSPALIHHPQNDVMKISFTYGTYNYGTQYTWSSLFIYNGTVYSGSLGAPLVDDNKRMIGHVSDLLPLNSYYEPNIAHIGKFVFSYVGGGTSDTRLKDWINPDNDDVFDVDCHRSIGNLEIIGDSAISMNGSSYYVSNLPPGLTVTWSITDSYYQGVLEEDEPITNQCTICGDASHEILNATLKASVYSSGTLLQTASKTVSTEEVFHGTYYNGQTTKPISLPNPLYVLPGTQVYITSPNLVGASAYYTGNVTPYIWSFDTNNGILYVGMPSSPSGTAAISVHVTTALGNSFTLPIVRASTVYSMSVGTNPNQITISLFELKDDEDKQNDGDADGLSTKDPLSWNLEIYNASTGKKVFNQEVDGASFSLDTTSWEPGVYIVKVTIGDEILSEKVVVKR